MTPVEVNIEGTQVRIDTHAGVVEILDANGTVRSRHPIQVAAGSVQGEFEDDTEINDFFG